MQVPKELTFEAFCVCYNN